MPDLKIAIEYDGVNWHKDKFEKDQEKNLAMYNNGIYFIRVREYGLKSTNIKNGYEINNEENFNDYEFIAMALTQIFIILNKICSNIKQVKFNSVVIREMRKLILQQYLKAFDNNNICKSWLFKYWSDENELAPYLVNERSFDKFWFNTFCGKIYESPFNIQMVCLARKDRDALFDLLKHDKACPFNNLECCPKNFNCFSKDYKKDCQYYTGKGNRLNNIVEELIELSNEPILTKYSRCKIKEYINQIFHLAKSQLPAALLMIIEASQSHKNEIVSDINENIKNLSDYKLLNDLFTNGQFLNLYCDYYDFDKLFNKNEIYLNLSKDETIYSIVYAAILYKNFLLLQSVLEIIYEKSDNKKYNIFVENAFLQFYTNGKDYLMYPFIEGDINRKILYDILLKNTFGQTQKFVERVLSMSLTKFREEIFTQYVDTLIEKRLITKEIKLELYYRLSDLPQIRDALLNKIESYS